MKTIAVLGTLDTATSHRVHADFTSATPQVYVR